MNTEERRQKRIATTKRSKAKSAEAVKVHDVVTGRQLGKWYGAHAVKVLTDRIRYLDEVNIKRVELYEVFAPLPTKEEYRKLQDAKYTTTIKQIIEDAMCEIESLKEEIQEWYDNLPESFQNGDKGSALQECVGALESIESPCMPEDTDEGGDIPPMQIVFLPDIKIRSRSDRLSESIRMLEAAADKLGSLNGATQSASEFMAEQCRDAIYSAESVEFPGMY